MDTISGTGALTLPGLQLSARGKIGDGIRIAPEGAASRAREDAIRLAVGISGICRTPWPRSPQLVVRTAGEQLSEHLIDFALQARRFLEIKDLKDQLTLGSDYWEVPADELPEGHCLNGWEILCRILHHRKVELIAWDRISDANSSHEVRTFNYAVVKSDKPGDYVFCPDALAIAFLELASRESE